MHTIFDYLAITRTMNVFRLLGDMCHLMAMLILLYKIYKTKSCTGISGRTQVLLATVFLARYLDLFSYYLSFYNTSMKLIFIGCTLLTVYLIYRKYRDTYDRKYDTFCAEALIVICIMMAFLKNYGIASLEVAWSFSIYLEAVAILPQLWMTRKMGCTAYMTHYLVALGLYRALYILNWAYRYLYDGHFDEISIGGGVVQTVIFSTFICYGCKKVNVSDLDGVVTKVSVIDCEKQSPLDMKLSDSDRQQLIDYLNRKPTLNTGNEKDAMANVHL